MGNQGRKRNLLPQIGNKKDESKAGGIWRLFSSEKLVSILTGSTPRLVATPVKSHGCPFSQYL